MKMLWATAQMMMMCWTLTASCALWSKRSIETPAATRTDHFKATCITRWLPQTVRLDCLRKPHGGSFLNTANAGKDTNENHEESKIGRAGQGAGPGHHDRWSCRRRLACTP